MDARLLRMLSGEELVAKGRNVTNCILPEVGTKEVTPNGSWLETKQIQTALEARKAVVAAERIDKVGALSHAEWRDLLKLAEVTQQVGGHWQYIGHNVNGTFYLLPEEALYLIETNSLLLKHNNVTVSLQKAYNLLLGEKMTLIQYKVYASLSRVGYKVFRHEKLSQAFRESNIMVQDKIVAEMETNDDRNSNMQLPSKVSFANSESTELDVPLTSANGNDLTKSTILLDPPITLDEESPKATTMSSETSISTDKTVKSIENDKISNSPGLPINDITKKFVNTVTTLSLYLPSPKNHALPPNGNVTNKESPTSLADDYVSNNEPGVSSNQPSLPPDVNTSLDPTISELDDKTGLETSSDPALPKGPSDDNTSNMEHKLASDPTLSLDKNVLNENSEMSSNELTLPPDCNDSNKDSIMSVAFLSDEITSSKECTMSSDQPLLPISPPKDTLQGNLNLSNNETATIHGTGASTDSEVIFSIDKLGVVRLENTENTADIESEAVSSTTPNFQSTKSDMTRNADTNKPRHMPNSYKVNQHKLLNRKIKPSDAKNLHDKFKDIPDFHNQQILTVNVPSEDYLPRNVYLNKSSYELNLKNFSSQLKSTPATGNGAMYRTIKNSSESEKAAVPSPDIPQLLSNTPSYQQPYNFRPGAWRPRFQPFQRPFFPQHRFNQHQFFYRMMHTIPPNFNMYRPHGPYRFNLNPRQRKRRRHFRDDHLQAVRQIAWRLKLSRAPNFNVKRSLIDLLARFNEIYNERMLVTPEFDIVEDTQNVETIELDDDEVQIKKPRLESATFDHYLAKVKEIAARLKSLVRNNQPVFKQKRAFCNLLKNFNKTFDADFCLDDKGELIDKKLVVVDSSDDDVVATDDVVSNNSKKRSSECDDDIDTSQRKKIKILRNPFSVLNKINEGASTSQAAIEIPVESSTNLSKYFDTNWLRNEDDFGKATICSKIDARNLMSDSQLLFDFMDNPDAFKNWIDLKIAFCMNMEMSAFEHDLTEHSNLTMDNSRLKPILQEETGDWAASLEKLRIIKTNTDVQESSLRIDFDVYNRDVQNFRKTDPPKPHFRVVCVDESSDFPSGAEVRAVHSKHHDNVTIVFAVVGVGSITYLQINPTDLPINVGND